MVDRSLAEVLVELDSLEAADSIAGAELGDLPDDAGAAGNVDYEMNQVRGRVALRQGHLESALEYLFRSAQTRGSPQLASWGPSLVLARELLEVGEPTAVLRFLELLSRFWEGRLAATTLSEAVRSIEAGQMPDGPRWY